MTVKTKRPSQEEMKSRIARFRELVPTKARHAHGKGIPQEVLEDDHCEDQDAHLLVIIQGKQGEFDDVGRVPETAQAIAG